jgi:hypothetical protein
VKCTPEVDTFGVHLYRQSQDRGGTFEILEKKEYGYLYSEERLHSMDVGGIM